MTARDRGELTRLSVELGADLASLDELAKSLAPWASREAADSEVLIPAALLHHLYTGIEAALARLAVGLEGSEPTGADSHRRLLALSALEVPGVRPAWFDAAQLDTLRELLGFRHLFRHGYGARYRAARLRELAQLAVRDWPSLRTALERARELVARLAAE